MILYIMKPQKNTDAHRLGCGASRASDSDVPERRLRGHARDERFWRPNLKVTHPIPSQIPVPLLEHLDTMPPGEQLPGFIPKMY
jgi:hypothetical protein